MILSMVESSELIAGRYQVDELLAGGGMGQVFAGRDLKLQRPVAIKFLRPDMAAQTDLKARFEAEARAAGRLSHPNVVAVFDTGEHDGTPYIIMELLSGRTLADEVAQGPMDPQRARLTGLEILSALAASHREGILHRDLKPGNILLAADGTAKVADFGVAKITEGMDLTNTGMMLGTPAYLAPERVAGEPASESTDVYSVGVILYELLTGAKPFDADTPLGLVRAIQEDDPLPLDQVRPDLDASLAAAVDRAMAKDPGRRYSSAEQMAEALGAVVVVPKTSPDATRVIPVAGPSTRVLAASTGPTAPAAAAAGPSGAPAAGSGHPLYRGRQVWERLSGPGRLRILVGVMLLLALLAIMRSAAAPGPSIPTPATQTSGTSLPASLEEALKRLEDSVKP